MRILLSIGVVLALTGVMLGAFGAHGLKSVVSSSALQTFETGVRYQLYHALAMLTLGAVLPYAKERWVIVAGWCFVVGVVFFSGSLYLLALTGIKWFGPITPLGGVIMMIGWVSLLVAVVKGRGMTNE